MNDESKIYKVYTGNGQVANSRETFGVWFYPLPLSKSLRNSGTLRIKQLYNTSYT